MPIPGQYNATSPDLTLNGGVFRAYFQNGLKLGIEIILRYPVPLNPEPYQQPKPKQDPAFSPLFFPAAVLNELRVQGQGLGFRVQGFGFGVQGLGFRF